MTAVSATLDRDEHTAIWLISGGHLCSHFYHLVLPPLFILLKPALGVSYAQLGLVMSVYFIATLLTQMPIGILVDRIGARPVLIAGLALHGGAVALAGLMPSYPVLLLAFFLGGVANSVFHPADFAILSASVRDSHHGRAFAAHTLGGSIGYAAAPLVMVLLSGWIGWQGALVAVGGIGVAMAVTLTIFGGSLHDAVTRQKSAAANGDAPAKRGNWRLMLTRPMVLFFLFYVATSASGAGMTNFSIVAFPMLYGMSPEMANTLLTVFLTAAILGALPGGVLADWAKREDLVLVVCFLVLAAMLLVLASGALTLWLIVITLIVAGLMRGLYGASRDILVRRASPDGSVGTTFGFVTLGYTLGQGGTPVIYGWILDMGMGSWVFIASAVFALMAIATVIVPASKK